MIPDRELCEDFRVRAIASAIAAGVMAGAVLLLSIDGAPRIWQGLIHRVWTWPLIWTTAVLALAALYALWTRRYKIARVCAAGEVTLILLGWAFAQFPYLVVPDITIYPGSAPPITIKLLAAALLVGSVLLLASYRYLLAVFKDEDRGLELMLNTMVRRDAGVMHGRGQIASHTAIWAAGVAASPLGRSLGVPTDKSGRVLVNQDLSVPNAPDVFVIGDLAAVTSEGKSVPGVAPAAAQEGHHAARNVIRVIRGEGVKPFRYRDKGTLASIGRGAAVADLGRIRLSGPLAWITWLGVHILYLIGFRNRFIVMVGWAWLYLWNERGARLITGDVEPLLKRGRRESQQIGPSQEITRERITIEGNSATY